MNFSNTKLLRKTLSLVIALVMMTTLFTGCMGKDKNTEPTDPPLTLPTAAPTEPATLPPETEPTELDDDMATVTQQLNIRVSPSEGAADAGTLYPGDKVEIIDIQESLGIIWGLIKVPGSNKEGWICMDFVEWSQMPDKSGEETPDETPSKDDETDDNDNKPSNGNGNTNVVAKGTVTASNLNIRSEATTDSEPVGSLKKGDRVEILEKKNNWGRIKQGWISLDHVKLDGTNTGNNGGNDTPAKPNEGNGSTKVISRGIVYNTDNLNVRSGPSVDNERVGGLKGGDRVEIYEKSGNWGRIDEGWISLGYVYIDGTGIGSNRYGTVTGDELNIRSGPGTKYDAVGSLNAGDEVTILFRVTVGDTVWGNIKQGWISLDYVDLEDADEEDEDDDITWDEEDDDDIDSDGSTKVLFRGIVTADNLNVRKSADSDSSKVGSLSYGDRVEILEEDGDWGRTKKGWINLDYVYADGSGDGGDYGTVTSGLNVRSGPGTKYQVIGSLDEGDEVEILFELEVGDTVWGNTEDGWISMDYVDMD